MCGIVGIFNKHNFITKETVIKMRDIFPYRGPDGQGYWLNSDATLALGHRRLSILDVSAAGNQPMADREQRFRIVFNGEIYNFIELRQELVQKDYFFSTKTDTEVLLAAYAEWGPECLHRFNGMWAFAIWDENDKSLFLARDRMGIKPLYYYWHDDTFYFASEVKAILSILNKPPEVNDSLVDAYMSFGYLPGEDTMCTGIKRLLPGHFMIVRDNTVKVKKYWDLHFDVNHRLGFADCRRHASELLNSAIDLRLRSDVPLGIFLSGGIDSSAVVGLLAQRVPERLKTFSVAYDFGSQFNEIPYARLVAEKFNTDHHELFVTPQEFMDFIPRFVWLMDEPVTEAAAISLYFVSRLAKEHVTVVLSGEGSDEIFGGYDLYRYMSILEKYHKLLGKTATALLARIAHTFLPAGNKLAKYMSLGACALEQRYKGISTYEEQYKKTLYTREFADTCRNTTNSSVLASFLNNLFEKTATNDILNKMLYFDTKTWLVDDLLIKADRMSMAASLELRVPFLDYRLVEFAATIPVNYKVNGNNGKYILKQMMHEVLPQEVIQRKKMGFPTPLKIMLQNHLQSYTKDILLSPATQINRYFRRESIEKLIKEHSTKLLDHHKVLWQLIVLENWLQGYGNPIRVDG